MFDGEPGAAFEDEVVIRRLRFTAEDTGFAVVDADRGGDDVVLVGTLAHLEERERVRIEGIWADDKRFGMQVKVRVAESVPPSGEEALLAYLKRVKHIGLGRAGRLLDRYGDDVLFAIDQDPAAAFRIAGLNPKRVNEAIRSWNALRSTRALHLLLAPHGLAWLVPRIAAEYGDRAHDVVRSRPYELTSVFGVGFAIADTIARAAGVPRDSIGRTRAAVIHVLTEAERDGSTCLPVPDLATSAAKLLGGPAPDAALLQDMFAAEQIVLVQDATVLWAYRPPTAKLEAELADTIRRLREAEPVLEPAHLPGPAPAVPATAGGVSPGATGELIPAPEQWAAVEAAFASRLSIVTGGPGTGKTATIRLICAAAKAQRASIALVAPTGRAARRMAESTGMDASTIHSALGWIPGQGPTKDEIDADLLVVDETSMANLELLVTLLRAVGDEMHVVLVGDADQLAPVGAGKPFAELVATKVVPVAELTHIFRQAAGSMIVRGAHAVRKGEPPSFVAGENLRRDLFLIERTDPQQALDEIESLVTQRLPAHYGVDPLTDIQVFAPIYRGALGIDAINTRLRHALNSRGEQVLGGRLRIGDKLMLSGRNLHELGLMNGTMLRLLEHRDEKLIVTADGMLVELPEEEAPRLQLAYACSIHKGQGIELPVAIVVAHPAAGPYFLRREMLYTAMTRAKVATLVVGTRQVVARAAATPDTSRRFSRLGVRLAEG
ncbi:AAA family ATPase [Solirubrobacter ginsenosidimutans]|uniref:AAA family ATPase n=1 Tax=Solirubrobacter ginsenosidimutans TaxID=490573 RepID=A0A9X3MRM2_9ACTN|nr:AAA family ATPase [Solirubrobacter ginsenosidimutans]MDA0160567.1 AAA family ATPase [Solirubrobacter ginsenosidimutans]